MGLTKILAGALMALLISACQPQTNSHSETSVNQATDKPISAQANNEEENKVPRELEYTGTVTYLNLEGGFFGIVTDKGEKFLPLNLAKEYQQNGAIINFTGQAQKEVITIQQWGTPFKIQSITLLKKGESTTRSEI